jgi:hypothetical protein
VARRLLIPSFGIRNVVVSMGLFTVGAVVLRFLAQLVGRTFLQHPLVEVDDIAALAGVVGQHVCRVAVNSFNDRFLAANSNSWNITTRFYELAIASNS